MCIKQLAICVQYIDHKSANVQVDFLKLIELSQGTAEVICDTVLTYLNNSALNLQRLAGGASDGAAVMIGSSTGVVTRIKGVVPNLFQLIVLLTASNLLHVMQLNLSLKSSNFNLLSIRFMSIFRVVQIELPNFRKWKKFYTQP